MLQRLPIYILTAVLPTITAPAGSRCLSSVMVRMLYLMHFPHPGWSPKGSKDMSAVLWKWLCVSPLRAFEILALQCPLFFRLMFSLASNWLSYPRIALGHTRWQVDILCTNETALLASPVDFLMSSPCQWQRMECRSVVTIEKDHILKMYPLESKTSTFML